MTSPTKPLRLALDVMGADGGVDTVIEGVSRAYKSGVTAHITLHGREGEIKPALGSREVPSDHISVRHTEDVITMDEKPTSSAGNTGPVMAMSNLQLRMTPRIDRPAITAVWPTKTGGRTAMLDVGANVEATATQLVQFAIMGEAYFRALTGKEKPVVGLLNVGAEELKGHDLIRTAADTLRAADPEMAFAGFVEGDDITAGEVDVVVTDGFTGNISLKTAEGTAHMLADWIKEALTGSLRSKLAASLMMPALRELKDRMNPSNSNGAPLLGLNGLVIKRHGGADADGVAAARKVAQNLASHPFEDEIARTVAKVEARTASSAENVAAAE